MRSYQVFSTMSAERALAIVKGLAEHSPPMYKQALAVASAAMNARPVYLQKQPMENQAQAVRRALSRVAANAVSEEILAVYFLECRKDLLVEWLDALGIEHDEGTLKGDDPVAPEAGALASAWDSFRAKDDDADRALLIAAFAAQSAIEWPDLDRLLANST